jgi:hypothetical protein
VYTSRVDDRLDFVIVDGERPKYKGC